MRQHALLPSMAATRSPPRTHLCGSPPEGWPLLVVAKGRSRGRSRCRGRRTSDIYIYIYIYAISRKSSQVIPITASLVSARWESTAEGNPTIPTEDDFCAPRESASRARVRFPIHSRPLPEPHAGLCSKAPAPPRPAAPQTAAKTQRFWQFSIGLSLRQP